MSGGLMSLIYGGAIHAREQGKIDAARISQAGKNKLAGSNASYAQWAQSFNNQRAMRAAGRGANAIMENIGRSVDQATYGRAMSRLASAEEAGANIAAAAAAGVGGSSVEVFNETANLNRALREDSEDRALRTDLMTQGSERALMIGDAAEGAGNQVFQAGLDYTTFQNHKRVSSTRALLTFAAAAGATYFGGPQAGAAVFDVTDAGNRAANGDFDGAAARMSSAFTGAVSGFKGYSDRGSAWGGDVYRRATQRRAASGANLQIGG